MQNLLKRANGLILLCSLSLLVITVTSCQDIKLKAAIELANKQCPIDMGPAGKITSVAYDGDNVVYTFRLNEDITNIQTMKDNPKGMKESIKIMFQNPTKEAKILLELVVKCNAGLQMIYIGEESGDKVTYELATDELKEILDTNINASQSDLTKLKSQVEMANLQFPMKASEEVMIEKIQLTDESVIYLCSVNEEMCSFDQVEENGEAVKQDIITTLTNQTDPVTQLFLKTCISCNRSIVYKYIGSQSGTQYNVEISVPELKRILKK